MTQSALTDLKSIHWAAFKRQYEKNNPAAGGNGRRLKPLPVSWAAAPAQRPSTDLHRFDASSAGLATENRVDSVKNRCQMPGRKFSDSIREILPVQGND
jgi:hypothetical protein